MPLVVPVKFTYASRDLWFDPQDLDILEADYAICSTERGTEIGLVTADPFEVPQDEIGQPLKPVLRVASDIDLQLADDLAIQGDEAMVDFRRLVKELDLEMKPVGVEYLFGGEKAVFYFAAEERVDFRQLVKDLSSTLHIRVDMRQIGVRDETRLVGGYAQCGQELCCTRFGGQFEPVSIRMAKEQDLPLNSSKISGVCGRLMCCLRYEQEAYEELLKKVPKQGAFVETKDGYGTAVQVNLLRQTVKVKLDNDSDDALHLFKANELAAVPGGRPKEGEPLPKVLHYVPEPEEEEDEKVDEWAIPMMVAPTPEPAPAEEEKKRSGNRRRRSVKPKSEETKAEKTEKTEKPEGGQKASGSRRQKPEGEKQPKPAHQGEKPNKPNRRRGHGRGGAKSGAEQRPIEQKTKQAPAQQSHAKDTAAKENGAPRGGNRRRNPYRKPRHKGMGEPKAE